MTELVPGWDDAASRDNETSRYINHETGELYPEGLDVPEPVPGAFPWTNRDVRDMSEGRAPTRPAPWLEQPQVQELSDGTLVANVPGQVDLDLNATPANVTPDGVNHFQRIVGDEAKCGGCGAAWPCSHAVSLQQVTAQQHAAGAEASRLQAASAVIGDPAHSLAGKLGPS